MRGQSNSHQKATPDKQALPRRIWSGAIRIGTALLLLGIYLAGMTEGLFPFSVFPAVAFGSIAVLEAGILVKARRETELRFHPSWMLVDLAAITLVVYVTGGAVSPLTVLYFAQTLAAGLLAGVRWSALVAAISWVSFGAVLAAEFSSLLPHSIVAGAALHENACRNVWWVLSVTVAAAGFLGASVFGARAIAGRSQSKDEQLTRIQREIGALFAISHSFAQSLPPKELATDLARGLISHFGYRRCAILVLREEPPGVESLVSLGRSGESPEYSPLAGEEARQRILSARIAWTSGTEAFVPISGAKGPFGLLVAQADRGLSHSEIPPLQTLANQLSMALERVRLHEETERLSLTDSLTGIANRKRLIGHLEQEVQRAERYGHELTLVLLDIDHFKRVNDAFGQLTGDELLRAMAGFLRDRIRQTDLVARCGEEEFAIVLAETSAEESRIFCERLRVEIASQEFPGLDRPIRITASFGISSVSGSSTASLGELLRTAEEALSHAKGAGKNRVSVA